MKTFAATLLGVALLSVAAESRAADIYSNTNGLSDQGLVLSAVNNVWFGDEVVLAGTDRYMTGFSFEYWSTNTSSLTVDVRLYLNDGADFNGYASPGTILYQYNGLSLNSSTADAYPYRGGVSFDLSDFGSPIFIGGNRVTLALNFQFTGGDAGPTMYTDPDVGQAFPDYWQLNGSTWQLVTNNTISVVNFGMQIQAVPEPSVVSFVLMGGLALLGGRRLFARK